MFNFLRNIIPQEEKFFDFFEEHCAVCLKACGELISLTEPGADVPAISARIADLEHQADRITHRCILALQKTFITPFDRLHIQRLMGRLDDIVDTIDHVSRRLEIYEIHELRPEVRAMGEVILKAVQYLGRSLHEMRDLKYSDAIKQHTIAIHQLENECDELLRNAMIKLFKEEESRPLVVIKWKEIFEHLEFASDLCEDVADIIQGVIIEAS